MRFIVDESTGMAVVEYLRRAGHNVLAGKSETCSKEHFFQGAPMDRRYLGHDQTFAIVECLSIAIQVGEIHSPSWYS